MTIKYHRVQPGVLEQCQDDADYFESLILGDQANVIEESITVGDGWDGLHYVLSDERRQGPSILEAFDEYGEAIIGRDFINDDFETDYGPPRYITSEKVVLLADLLADVDEDLMYDNFSPGQMDQAMVYPEEWSINGDNSFDVIKDTFDAIRGFYERAANDGHVVIIVVE